MNARKYFSYIALALIGFALLSSSAVLYAQNAPAPEGAPPAGLDATEPSDVENFKATAGDGQVTLTWKAAQDNVGVSGYKIYRGTKSVKAPEDIYDLPAIPVGNVTTHTIDNLTNGQKYFFTVTALDGAGNESINYSLEAEATPEAGNARKASIEDNGKAPEVKKVEAKDGRTVLVEFSEPVWLPQESPQSAFQIRKTENEAQLVVERAEIDADDKTGATIKLTTAPQEKDKEYEITVGIEIQDYYDNPVISGTADTGVFKGKEPPAEKQPETPKNNPPSSDVDPPKILSAEADFNDRMTVTLSEAIVLPPNAKDKVTVTSKTDGSKLEVKNVGASVDGKILFITTAPQKAHEYDVALMEIKDIAGNALDAFNNTWTLRGNAPNDTPPPNDSGIKDLIPPEDVTKLIAKLKNAEQNIVELRWEHSKNTAKDLSDYLLYQGSGKNAQKMTPGVSVGASANTVEVRDLKPGQWYTFKIGATDTSGNESKGAFANFYLPQTGPGMIAAGITALLMGWSRRRKK